VTLVLCISVEVYAGPYRPGLSCGSLSSSTLRLGLSSVGPWPGVSPRSPTFRPCWVSPVPVRKKLMGTYVSRWGNPCLSGLVWGRGSGPVSCGHVVPFWFLVIVCIHVHAVLSLARLHSGPLSLRSLLLAFTRARSASALSCSPSLGPAQPPVQRATGQLFPGIKMLERGTSLSPPYSAEVKMSGSVDVFHGLSWGGFTFLSSTRQVS
jgi:hypothetical protein